MNVVQINASYRIGSTGKIMNDLNDTIVEAGHNGFMVFAYTNEHVNNDNLYCTSRWPYYLEVRKNLGISRITGLTGYRNINSTKAAVRWIKEKQPDIIHLHNIHGDWINLRILSELIKEVEIPVIWTLHDCWAFTGRCSHFELSGCDQWKTGCTERCPNLKVYPISYIFDYSKKMFKDKVAMFGSIRNLTIVTPSQWLADYVKKSFLGKYPVHVINNGINIDIYKPTKDLPEYIRLDPNKKVILGVAGSWSKTKGLDDFVELNKIIDHSRYQIVLVGLKQRQIETLPNSIIKVGATQNQDELAGIYSVADVFVNLTYQDNYPTTNLEAMACGTPVLTYRTGGSPESILHEEWIVNPGDIKQVLCVIEKIVNSSQSKRFQISEEERRSFDKKTKYKDYLKLYTSVYEKAGEIK